MKRRAFLFLILIIPFLSACHPPKRDLEPKIFEPPHPKETFRENRSICQNGFAKPDFSTSPFPPLTPSELSEDWGKEYWIGLSLAADFDLYRAITSFKRALLLLPEGRESRRLEIQYSMALSYYLGKKYQEAIYQIECSPLIASGESFPAFYDLMLILYDSYIHIGNGVQAAHILSLLDNFDPEKGEKLHLLSAVQRVDLKSLYDLGVGNPKFHYLEGIVSNYCCEALSVKKAQMLNALLPGAGYWYVGQKETAVTAFVVNSLFIAASACFFSRGNLPAGIITASFESGWYVGGIWGAGLAAKTYNERLYESYAAKITAKERYFPIMMVRFTF